ncbi:MAG TPA: histidine phosphatase family protein [Blastocatellia bacterium]|nr:histidine phosphatase family protein [Blastocatellia bacterium]
MGTLTFVRHGQARAFEKDSDQLSPLGEEQARLLGRYWVSKGVSFNEIYSGTLVRQQRTAEIVGQCFLEAGMNWPERQATPDLNEYDADGISRKLIPAFAERDEKFRGLLAEFEAHKHSPDRNRYFQRMFEVVTQLWLSGELEVDGFESWTSFRTRVRRALKQITSAEGSGRRVAVFTSGGVIGATVQTVLDAPEQQALQINWRVKNCSLTEFTFGSGRISMDTFNSLPHLDDMALQTFR